MSSDLRQPTRPLDGPLRRLRRAGGPAPFPVRRLSAPRRSDDIAATPARVALALLTLGALALRLSVPRGLWLDEAISVRQAHMGLGALIQSLATGDRHPPLHYLALWVVVHVFGDGELSVRLPSIIAGTLIIPILFAIGAELFDRRTGLLAALFGAVAPLLVWYSQEARMYAFVTCFGALAVLGCVRVIRRGGTGGWVLFTVGATGLLWSHWFAPLMLVILEGAILVTLLDRRRRGEPLRRLVTGWLASSAILVWQLVPLAILGLAEARATGVSGGYAGGGDAGQAGVSFYSVMANLSWTLWGFHPLRATEELSAAWPLLMLLSLALLGRRLDRRTLFLAVCWLGAPAALLVVGLFHPAVFEVRYFIVGVPIASVLLARLILGWTRRGWGRVVLAGAVLATLAVGLVDQQLDPANPRRYDYRQAIAQVRRDSPPGMVLLYEPPEMRYVLEYYAPGVTARPLDGPLPDRAQAPRVTVLGSFLDQARYRQVVDRSVGSLGYLRGRPSRTDYPGATLWSFR